MNSSILSGVRRLGTLSDADRDMIVEVLRTRVRHIEAGETFIDKNEALKDLYIVLEGWAFRYKILANGRRQIIAYLVPGDITDIPLFMHPRMDHSVCALTTLSVATIPSETVETLFSGAYPGIARAFWAKSLAAISLQREWTVNLGQRSAPERIGHILCELFHRLRAVNLADDNQCSMPLTQSDLAEATGLSLVHVNKRVQDLRAAGLIILRGKTLTVPDLARLEKFSLFEKDYLCIAENKVGIAENKVGIAENKVEATI